MICQHGPRDSLQDTTLLEERQKSATFFRRAELLGIMFDQNQTQHLIEQKMLDEHHPTWAAKRSNNVGLSKVGTLNPTLFDSLAKALTILL